LSALSRAEPLLALTEQAVSATERIVVAVNQSPAPLRTHARLADGWRLVECLHGAARADGRDVLLDLPSCDGAVLRVGCGGEG
jgi:hypothetical protein